MRSEDLLKALGEVDEKYIAEADPSVKKVFRLEEDIDSLGEGFDSGEGKIKEVKLSGASGGEDHKVEPLRGSSVQKGGSGRRAARWVIRIGGAVAAIFILFFALRTFGVMQSAMKDSAVSQNAALVNEAARAETAGGKAAEEYIAEEAEQPEDAADKVAEEYMEQSEDVAEEAAEEYMAGKAEQSENAADKAQEVSHLTGKDDAAGSTVTAGSSVAAGSTVTAGDAGSAAGNTTSGNNFAAERYDMAAEAGGAIENEMLPAGAQPLAAAVDDTDDDMADVAADEMDDDSVNLVVGEASEDMADEDLEIAAAEDTAKESSQAEAAENSEKAQDSKNTTESESAADAADTPESSNIPVLAPILAGGTALVIALLIIYSHRSK